MVPPLYPAARDIGEEPVEQWNREEREERDEREEREEREKGKEEKKEKKDHGTSWNIMELRIECRLIMIDPQHLFLFFSPFLSFSLFYS